MLSFSDGRFWELKEAAKWSLALDERKKAVAELISTYGEAALQVLSEIKDITVHDEIRKICMEAIMSAEKKDTETGIIDNSTLDRRIRSKAKNVKKKKTRKNSKKGRRA